MLAQQGFIPAPTGVRLAERWRPESGPAATRIVGTVVDIYLTPVAHARVQLRDLTNGRVVQLLTADGNGAYAFTVADSGTYVVEMVLADGYVIALSNAGSPARYETLQTLIQLPGRWDAPTSRVQLAQDPTQYFGMSAQTTMTAATLQLAMDLDVAPADPGEPVSP